MTDRVSGLTVVLDRDYRIDDVETIINAIQMIRGVVKVEKSIKTSNSEIVRMRCEAQAVDKMVNFIKEFKIENITGDWIS